MKKLIILLMMFASTAHAGTVSFTQLSVSGDLTESKYNSDLNTIYQKVNSNLQTDNIENDTLTEADFADEINPRVRTDEAAACNKVVTGLLTVTTAGTLVSSVPSGTAYVDGYRVNKASSTPKTFTASRWTWVDIDINGDFTYSEQAIGSSTPAVAANSLRLTRVSTDGTQVLAVSDLRTTSCANGPFSILKDTTTSASLHDLFAYGSPVLNGNDNGWIQGLNTEWLTHTTFNITPGSAYINGKYRALTADSTVTTGNDDPANGTNGLDSGAIASSTAYNVFAVADQDEASSLSITYTTSATPAGVTNYRKIGQIKTDGSNLFKSEDILRTHSPKISEVVVGSYTGNGADDRTITVGYADQALTTQAVFIRSVASVAGGYMFRGQANGGSFTNSPANANTVQAVGVNNFQIGSDSDANANAQVYYYMAIGY